MPRVFPDKFCCVSVVSFPVPVIANLFSLTVIHIAQSETFVCNGAIRIAIGRAAESEIPINGCLAQVPGRIGFTEAALLGPVVYDPKTVIFRRHIAFVHTTFDCGPPIKPPSAQTTERTIPILCHPLSRIRIFNLSAKRHVVCNVKVRIPLRRIFACGGAGYGALYPD
jgi:hypothetical protein